MPDEDPTSPKPKSIIVDRKFKPEDLKILRWREYVQDLGECLKIFQKWGHDIVWVSTGVDAMLALREYGDQVKCVVLEAYAPGGGFTVARLIRFKPDCRHIPVYVMSHQLAQKDIDEGKRIGIFDCLLRPFKDAAFLEGRLANGIEVHGAKGAEEVDPKEHILRELDNITGLPAMPTVYNEIEKLSEDPDATTEQYGKVIEVDPGITAQMLRLCNSSAFSFNRRITSVVDAVNLLGLQTVVDFVRTLSVVGAFRGGASGFDTQSFWRHSIACGVAAKLLGQRPEVAPKLETGDDDPFMAGMVHDIGKQVLGHFFNEMFGMVVEEMGGEKTMFDSEREILGITHTDIGAALAEKWQLPDFLVQVIGSHQTPGTEESHTAMVNLIHLANCCSKQVGFALVERPHGAAPSPRTLEQLELDEEAIGEVFKELEGTVRTQVNDTFAAIFA